MNLTIERLNGDVIDFEQVGIGIRDFMVASPFFNTNYDTLEGLPGAVDVGTEIGYRMIKASLYHEADSMENFAMERDKVFTVFRSEEPFYLIDSRMPGKRWKVKAYQNYEPDQHGVFLLFNVTFTVPSGYAESVVSRNSKFDSAVFRFHNEGNVGIDMRTQMETEIDFRGASSNLTITNKTTGDVWTYNGSSVEDDTILLKGVRSTKNGNSIFGQTNHKLISFAPGWNDFEITGATDFTITIRTRFYFL